MRVVAGKWKGRRLTPPPDRSVRPTSDRVKEAWMSIVNADLAGAEVLDLFAGSGALGIEALSRGAASVDFVDASTRSLAVLRKNLESLDAGAAATVIRSDAVKFVERLAEAEYDVAFVDPPYASGLAEAIANLWLATPFARVIGIEHDKRIELPRGDRRVYGDTVVTMFRTA